MEDITVDMVMCHECGDRVIVRAGDRLQSHRNEFGFKCEGSRKKARRAQS